MPCQDATPSNLDEKITLKIKTKRILNYNDEI